MSQNFLVPGKHYLKSISAVTVVFFQAIHIYTFPGNSKKKKKKKKQSSHKISIY